MKEIFAEIKATLKKKTYLAEPTGGNHYADTKIDWEDVISTIAKIEKKYLADEYNNARKRSKGNSVIYDEWILCHENLPEKSGNYNVTIFESEDTITLYYDADRNIWVDNNSLDYGNSVVAWKRLPERHQPKNLDSKAWYKAQRVDNGKWVEGLLYFNAYMYTYNIIVPMKEQKEFVVKEKTICRFVQLYDSTTWEDLSVEEKKEFLSTWNVEENRRNKATDWIGKKIWTNC